MRPAIAALLFATLPALAACTTPAPQFFGATRHAVTRGGIDFVVFHRGSRAEVMRLGYLARRDRDRVPALMAEAAGIATGCRVIANSMTTRLPGDTGEARFDLDCRAPG